MKIEEPPQVDFFAGGGELGARIRAFDWSATPVGAIGEWPQSLKTAVRIMLGSRYPMFVWWGREQINIYNDAYAPALGARHPEALGRSAPEVWAEIWPIVGPQAQIVLDEGRGTWNESVLLLMERSGFLEETYFTFSYSPAPGDDGSVAGVFCVCTEDTGRVFGERQLRLLRELAVRIPEARTLQEVCEGSAEAFALNRRDLPFAAIYLAEPDGASMSLACASGIERGHPCAPEVVELAAHEPWPFAAALGQPDVVVVDHVGGIVDAPLPTGDWDEPPSRAALIPLASVGPAGTSGVLVVGLSPFRTFGDDYRAFLTLVGGQVAAGIASARAHEDERARREALADLDRAKSAFFANVSHELRTPLTLILGPLEELLARPGLGAGEERTQLELIRRNALRLLRQVNTLLDFSRAGESPTVGDFRPVQLDRLTTDLAASFGELIERSGVKFQIECERFREPIYVDVTAWETILLNLLSNAFKFTLAGEIRVTLDGGTAGQARLQVADTGCGIPDVELPRLFERFYRIRSEHARTHEGTGIGLALVRELVELHGGAIEVESAFGRGTTFTVSIPLGSKHLPPGQVGDAPHTGTPRELAPSYVEEASRWVDDGHEPASFGGTADWTTSEHGSRPRPAADAHRVVVVDDNADMRDHLVRVLGRHWNTEGYPDGQAALESILSEPPALVVTDVMMPRLDGFGLLSTLRSHPRTATLPVIVVSARAGEESSVEGLEGGADDYLVKPFSARELVARVHVNLELAGLRAEAGRLTALEEVRSRLITTVSHELRTPVSAIYGAARTLDRGALDEETRGELLAVISSESERLARITGEILTTEALTSGVLTIASAPLDLCAAALEAVAAVQARLGGSLSVRTSTPGRPVRINADRRRLQRVLSNLLDNAIKYSPNGGEIAVEVDEVDGSANIVVADPGIGIPAEAREHVFERFYRVDPEQTGGVGGSGLGLTICRETVEAMGGRIRFEPNTPEGSRFVVAFPVA